MFMSSANPTQAEIRPACKPHPAHPSAFWLGTTVLRVGSLELLDPPAGNLAERFGEIDMALEQTLEIALVELEKLARSDCHHRRRAGGIRHEERDLAEKVALRKSHPALRQDDLNFARGNEVHAVGNLSPGYDVLPRRYLQGTQDTHQPRDRRNFERRKQRHPRNHRKGHDEIAAPNLLLEAAGADADGQRHEQCAV